MGNCVGQRSWRREEKMVRVITVNGGVMELRPPVTAGCITDGFPGHGVFRAAKSRSSPLLHNEDLLPGETYYLRPFNSPHIITSSSSSSIVASYRVSFNQKQEPEAPPRYGGGGRGVWKVKLVISPAHLADILSQETRTEALIESVRTVANCRHGTANSAANSDQWSLSSSRKAPSECLA